MADKYIDSEAVYHFAQDQLKKETGAYSKGWNNAMNVIKSAMHSKDAIPAADVREVVRGKWKVNPVYIKCSLCKEAFLLIPQNFCPNCGADMREVEHE